MSCGPRPADRVGEPTGPIDRRKLQDHEVFLPLLEDAMDHDPEDAVAVVQPGPLHAAPQDVELLAEHEVLQGEARPVRGKGADQGQQIEKQSHGGGSSTAVIDARRLGAKNWPWMPILKGARGFR